MGLHCGQPAGRRFSSRQVIALLEDDEEERFHLLETSDGLKVRAQWGHTIEVDYRLMFPRLAREKRAGLHPPRPEPPSQPATQDLLGGQARFRICARTPSPRARVMYCKARGPAVGPAAAAAAAWRGG